MGAWQTWDADSGGWWSLNGTASATAGNGVKPLSAIIAAQPNARIVPVGSGGLRIAAGFGEGAWDNFVGDTDNVTVDFTGAPGITFDFEPPNDILSPGRREPTRSASAPPARTTATSS